MLLDKLCPPALLYIAFSTTHIIIDTVRGLHNTALVKFLVMIVFSIVINLLCNMGLSVVAWFIVFIPFIMMTVISSVLLFTFGLSPTSGKLNYAIDYPGDPSKKTSDLEKKSDPELPGNNLLMHRKKYPMSYYDYPHYSDYTSFDLDKYYYNYLNALSVAETRASNSNSNRYSNNIYTSCTNAPTFKVETDAKKLVDLKYLQNTTVFTKYIDVFGIKMIASAKVPNEKLINSANYMANILDNNNDCIRDSQRRTVVNNLAATKSFVLHLDSSEIKNSSGQNKTLTDMGVISQGDFEIIFASEIFDGTSNGKKGEQFRKNFNLYKKGLAKAYPAIFSSAKTSSEINSIYVDIQEGFMSRTRDWFKNKLGIGRSTIEGLSVGDSAVKEATVGDFTYSLLNSGTTCTAPNIPLMDGAQQCAQTAVVLGLGKYDEIYPSMYNDPDGTSTLPGCSWFSNNDDGQLYYNTNVNGKPSYDVWERICKRPATRWRY